jgi:hypothetical protein
MMLLTDRYADKILGVLSCFDRVVIQGTLPTFCYAQGMAGFLSYNDIRIFDYPRFAEPLRDELRDNADEIARENGLDIEFIRKKNFRKENRIRDILKERGNHPSNSRSRVVRHLNHWQKKKVAVTDRHRLGLQSVFMV